MSKRADSDRTVRLVAAGGSDAGGSRLVAYRTRCRCGAALAFSCEDVATGRPAEGADFWCSDPVPEKGPHDWGVVVYREEPTTR